MIWGSQNSHIFQLPTSIYSKYNVLYSLKALGMLLHLSAICPQKTPSTYPSPQYPRISSGPVVLMSFWHILRSILLDLAVNTWALSLVSFTCFAVNHQTIFTSLVHNQASGHSSLLLIFFSGWWRKLYLFLIPPKSLYFTPTVVLPSGSPGNPRTSEVSLQIILSFTKR